MRVLIVKTSSMGDIIHTLPALTDAAKACPEAVFDWLVEEDFCDIPAWHPHVNDTITVAWRRLRKHPLALLRNKEWRHFKVNMKRRYYDYLIDAQGLLKSAMFARLPHGPIHGYNFSCAREPLAALFYRYRYKIAKNQHATERSRRLFAKVLGYDYQASPLDYGIKVADFALHHTQFQNIVFVHGASSPHKQWSNENWGILGRLCGEQGYRIYLPWHGEQQRQDALAIAQTHPSFSVLPPLQLDGVARVIASATALVTVDTGLAHLAAALQKPVLTLYGATQPERIGTQGTGITWHIQPEANSKPTLLSLSPRKVWQQLKKMLATVNESHISSD